MGLGRSAPDHTTLFWYTSTIGAGLRARTSGGRAAETLLAGNVLNKMTDLGRPAPYNIGR